MPRKSAVSKYLAEIGSKGGKKGGAKKVPKGFSTMDPERRKEIAKLAIAKRWANAKKNKAPK
jgi:hypothetical protein